MKRFLMAAILLVGACVPLPPGEAPGSPRLRQRVRPEFPALDPGAKVLDSLHFQVHAYGTDGAGEASRRAENLYTKLMTDTGLYSFLPEGLYPIIIYASRGEFLRKTRLPAWSSGAAVGNAIYTFEGPHLGAVLAHEITHLIFYEYMGRGVVHTRWFNEGLAVYEEQEAAPDLAPSSFVAVPISFDEMVRMTPFSEEQRRVSAWYQQVGSVVRFMIERGGRVGVSHFLRALRSGRNVDQALQLGFPGSWRNLSELEAAWRAGR